MEGTERYPWLDNSNERKYMSDREILEKNINLDNSCFAKWEKKDLRSLIYKYKNAFSLRDEKGTCPNIEVEIDIMDKSPFLLDHFMLEKRTKSFWIGRLSYLGILKEGFSAYSSPVMLVSRK